MSDVATEVKEERLLWRDRRPAYRQTRNEEWPGGLWGKKQRNAFLALLTITGKPSLAYKLMDELELWTDERRPEPVRWKDWAAQWREGRMTVPQKVQNAVQAQYDAVRRADMDASIRDANAAHRAISGTVIAGEFDKDTSGALQHLGQFIAIGTEKRQQVYAPKQMGDQSQVMPLLGFLVPPPERQALPQGNVIEGEVRQVD